MELCIQILVLLLGRFKGIQFGHNDEKSLKQVQLVFIYDVSSSVYDVSISGFLVGAIVTAHCPLMVIPDMRN